MAVRLYIGARYTIKIYENSLDPSSANWEAGIAYEYLTLVIVNNDAYLSKKDVPSTVGSPAGEPDYWVRVGNFNGQVANLQNQIDIIVAEITNKLMLSDRIWDSIVTVAGDSYLSALDAIIAKIYSIAQGLNVNQKIIVTNIYIPNLGEFSNMFRGYFTASQLIPASFAHMHFVGYTFNAPNLQTMLIDLRETGASHLVRSAVNFSTSVASGVDDTNYVIGANITFAFAYQVVTINS